MDLMDGMDKVDEVDTVDEKNWIPCRRANGAGTPPTEKPKEQQSPGQRIAGAGRACGDLRYARKTWTPDNDILGSSLRCEK